MTQDQKDQEVYKIYAVLGELFVLEKQASQRLKLINAQTEEFEAKLVKLLETPIEPPKQVDPSTDGEA